MRGKSSQFEQSIIKWIEGVTTYKKYCIEINLIHVPVTLASKTSSTEWYGKTFQAPTFNCLPCCAILTSSKIGTWDENCVIQINPWFTNFLILMISIATNEELALARQARQWTCPRFISVVCAPDHLQWMSVMIQLHYLRLKSFPLLLPRFLQCLQVSLVLRLDRRHGQSLLLQVHLVHLTLQPAALWPQLLFPLYQNMYASNILSRRNEIEAHNWSLLLVCNSIAGKMAHFRVDLGFQLVERFLDLLLWHSLLAPPLLDNKQFHVIHSCKYETHVNMRHGRICVEDTNLQRHTAETKRCCKIQKATSVWDLFRKVWSWNCKLAEPTVGVAPSLHTRHIHLDWRFVNYSSYLKLQPSFL